MRIPFDLAETLALVVDEGTLDGAARRMHITPSAVSQRIKALEEIIGRVLLIRSKPARATPDGAAIVRLARQAALLEHDTALALGVDVDAGRHTSVPLAVNADSLATWFLQPLARLGERHAVVFEVHRDDQEFTAALLESGTVMGAVTSRDIAVSGCRVSPLGAMRYDAVASPVFVSRWFTTGVDATTLALAPLIDFDRRDDLQSRWLTAVGAGDAQPPRHHVPSSSDFAHAAQLGMGWALLPTLQAADAVASGALVRLGGPSVEVPLFWQQWNLHSPLLGDIADEIIGEARRALAPVNRR
ncbi:LysR family transcriptional regulator ArgP [Microbacterium koreense]|uniref:LysR family transcriptional regulator ArgP n=1 Tax=Microbacterium koreense TaxID=323761 RepID=A0ABW2ZQL1_9MICO